MTSTIKEEEVNGLMGNEEPYLVTLFFFYFSVLSFI